VRANESRPAKAQAASASGAPSVVRYIPSDVFTVERIVQMWPRGADLTIDDFRPAFEIAQISPQSYGPLLGALCRRGELIKTDRCRSSRKPSRNGGLIAVYQRPVLAGRRAAAQRP